MADPRYEIDWSADLTPALAHLAAARNASKANKRSDEYLQLQREAQQESSRRHSAEVERQKVRDEHAQAIETWNAMPTLQRAAMKSVGMANTNPYGVKFDETHDLPANVEGPDMSPAAEEARFAPKPPPTQEFHTPPQPPTGSLLASEEGPELDPAAEAARHTLEGPQMAPSGYAGGGIDAFGEAERQKAANNLDVVGTGLHGAQPEPELAAGTPDVAPAPEHPLIAAAKNASGFEAPGPEGKRRLFASYQGNRFEVPEQNDSTGLGAEYDAIYNRMLEEPGITPSAAFKAVLADYQKDQAEKGRDARLTRTLGFRETNREDQQAFQGGENEKYKNERITIADRDRWNTNNNRARVAASAPGLKADAANARDMSVLERTGSAIRQTGQFNKLAASDKTVRGIMVNIASGTVPLQHADAQIQLARFFRQAQPTEGEMHMLYQNLGGTKDKWNQFIAKLESGDLSAEQMRQLRISSKAVKREHEEDLHRFREVAKSRLGPGRGFDMMPDQAQGLYDSMMAELGINDPVPLFETEGGTTLGAGKRPTVRPRGEKKTALDALEEELDRMGSGGR